MANGNSNSPSFLEILTRRIGGSGDRRGVDGSTLGDSRVFRVAKPVFSSGRGDFNRNAGSGNRRGSGGCACDGKRRVSSLRG